MSRRLVNRSGASARPSTNGASSTASLPPYEPPSFPLDDTARRALTDIANNRTLVTKNYAEELKAGFRHHNGSVADLHERLREARDRLEQLRKKRVARAGAAGEEAGERTDDEVRLEEHVAALEEKVEALTVRSEKAVRDAVDRKAELEDEPAVLNEVVNIMQNARPAAAHDENVPPPSIHETLREVRAQRDNTYESMTAHERYALNNDYAGFKKIWHDAQVGEDGPPLPDASRWFDRDGKPVMLSVTGGGDDEEDDDDVQVAREKLSLTCPLTLRVMEEPYSNRKCKHTFERAAIWDYLSDGSTRCPQTGCSQEISLRTFDRDFYADQAMERRIKRAMEAQEDSDDLDEDEDSDEDMDNVDGDSELAISSQRKRRRTKTPKKERRYDDE